MMSVKGHYLGPTAGLKNKDSLTQVSYAISKISAEYRLFSSIISTSIDMNLLKYKLKESASVNVNRTDVLSKSIHLGVN
jgi:hypothetical protein